MLFHFFIIFGTDFTFPSEAFIAVLLPHTKEAGMEENYLKKELYDLVKKEDSVFDFIQESSLDGMWYWDLDNPENEWMNERFWTTLGYDPTIMPHKASAWQDIINQDDLNTALENFQMHVKDPSHPYDQIVRYKHKNGSTVWIRCRGLAIRDENGKAYRMLGAHHNITELKEAEMKLKEAKAKAEESDMLKSAFLANMSHEIRTPMNAILGFSKLLSENQTSTEKKDQYLDIIQQAGKRLMTIISDIIDISKIEANQLKVIPEQCNLNVILDGLYQQFTLAQNSNIELLLEMDLDDDHSNICIDPTRLSQAFSNLLENSQKFTSKGYIKFGYGLTESDFIFFVEDTGIGIPEAEQESVFERFNQSSLVNPGTNGGTGLGLSITKGIVDLFKGSISVDKDFKQGTRISFSIPKTELKYPVRIQNSSLTVNPISEVKRKKKSILIVEDNKSHHLLLREYLSDSDSDVHYACNGANALKMFDKDQHFDLVFMDMKMPKLDGIELTRKLREQNIQIPIIGVTANKVADELKAFKESGCNEILVKPVSRRMVVDVVERYFEYR